MATHKVVIPFKFHEGLKKFMGWKVKGSRILRRADGFFLHVTFRKAAEEKEPGCIRHGHQGEEHRLGYS